MSNCPGGSRFGLAYDAAHSLALVALRRVGYRPENKRHIVFDLLPATVFFILKKKFFTIVIRKDVFIFTMGI